MFTSQGTPYYGPQGQWNYNAQPQAVPKFKNTLSDDEINELTKNSGFSLGITREEMLRAVCNHRTKDGLRDALIINNDGTVQCQICGYKFKPTDPNTTTESIMNAVYEVIDQLQSVKMMNPDMPIDAAREYFQIIPLLEKLPKLYSIAANNMAKHNPDAWNYNGYNMNAVNMYNAILGAMGGGMNYDPNFVQPMQGMNGYYYGGQAMPMGYPDMTQQAQMQMPNAGGAQSVPVGAVAPNMAFGAYGVPGNPNPALNGGYQAGTQGFSYDPNNAQQAQPANPQTTATTEGDKVNVQSTIKA